MIHLLLCTLALVLSAAVQDPEGDQRAAPVSLPDPTKIAIAKLEKDTYAAFWVGVNNLEEPLPAIMMAAATPDQMPRQIDFSAAMQTAIPLPPNSFPMYRGAPIPYPCSHLLAVPAVVFDENRGFVMQFITVSLRDALQAIAADSIDCTTFNWPEWSKVNTNGFTSAEYATLAEFGAAATSLDESGTSIIIFGHGGPITMRMPSVSAFVNNPVVQQNTRYPDVFFLAVDEQSQRSLIRLEGLRNRMTTHPVPSSAHILAGPFKYHNLQAVAITHSHRDPDTGAVEHWASIVELRQQIESIHHPLGQIDTASSLAVFNDQVIAVRGGQAFTWQDEKWAAILHPMDPHEKLIGLIRATDGSIWAVNNSMQARMLELE